MKYHSIFHDQLFAGQHILVTGGGSGIGRCIAHELASLGATISLLGRKKEKLETVATEIQQDTGKLPLIYCCDIREETAVQQQIKIMIEQQGPLHGLMNNAGGQYPAPLEKISAKGFDAVVSTNLLGGFIVAREVFTQSMSIHGGGNIVNMLADMHNGMPTMGHSGAARAGMENFTKTAAIEWAHANVRVNAVAPGWIMSSGMDTYDDAFKSIIKGFKQASPMNRLGNEAEVSAAVCFLLSPGAAFINGVTLRIDGGASLGNRAFPLAETTQHSKIFEGFHRAEMPKIFAHADQVEL